MLVQLKKTTTPSDQEFNLKLCRLDIAMPYTSVHRKVEQSNFTLSSCKTFENLYVKVHNMQGLEDGLCIRVCQFWIFTYFTLQYIKLMIENRYLILVLAFKLNFAPPLQKSNFEVQDTTTKSVKQNRCGIIHCTVSIFLNFHQKSHLDG